MKILKFHWIIKKIIKVLKFNSRITNFMKIIEFHLITNKVIKTIEFDARIIKIMNIQELEARHMKIIEIINSMQELLKQNENHRISNENQENHGNHEIQLETQ